MPSLPFALEFTGTRARPSCSTSLANAVVPSWPLLPVPMLRLRRDRRPQLATKTKIRQPGVALGVGMLLLLVTLLLCPFTSAAAEEAGHSSTIEIDGHYENQTLTRLAFGSCNKQVCVCLSARMSLSWACVCGEYMFFIQPRRCIASQWSPPACPS
jgi:hypothetical protein